MNVEEIQNFLDKKTSSPSDHIRITFKKRDTIHGLFIRDHKDYAELKSKNFWRIVTSSRLDDYKKSKDIAHARIFHGSEFQRLAISKEN